MKRKEEEKLIGYRRVGRATKLNIRRRTFIILTNSIFALKDYSIALLFFVGYHVTHVGWIIWGWLPHMCSIDDGEDWKRRKKRVENLIITAMKIKSTFWDHERFFFLSYNFLIRLHNPIDVIAHKFRLKYSCTVQSIFIFRAAQWGWVCRGGWKSRDD